MKDSLRDVLFSGESLLWTGKPQKICYLLLKASRFLPAAILFLVFDGVFIGTIISSGFMAHIGYGFLIFLIVFFAFHLLPVWNCIIQIFVSSREYKNIDYALTSHRIITRTGVIGRDFQSVNYSDITNIKVEVSVLERFFKCGTIVILTSSKQPFILKSVLDPYNLYTKINKLYIDMKTDAFYPNAFRPNRNPGYNTRYTGN